MTFRNRQILAPSQFRAYTRRLYAASCTDWGGFHSVITLVFIKARFPYLIYRDVSDTHVVNVRWISQSNTKHNVKVTNVSVKTRLVAHHVTPELNSRYQNVIMETICFRRFLTQIMIFKFFDIISSTFFCHILFLRAVCFTRVPCDGLVWTGTARCGREAHDSMCSSSNRALGTYKLVIHRTIIKLDLKCRFPRLCGPWNVVCLTILNCLRNLIILTYCLIKAANGGHYTSVLLIASVMSRACRVHRNSRQCLYHWNFRAQFWNKHHAGKYGWYHRYRDLISSSHISVIIKIPINLVEIILPLEASPPDVSSIKAADVRPRTIQGIN